MSGIEREFARIRAILQSHLPELRRQYGVRSFGLFGSYVRGEQRPGSDLDLLVEFDDRPLTLLQFIALENHLSDLLGVKVDLVEKEALKPAIGRHILKEVVPI
jgi:predicted nucleotidyltransferase